MPTREECPSKQMRSTETAPWHTSRRTMMRCTANMWCNADETLSQLNQSWGSKEVPCLVLVTRNGMTNRVDAIYSLSHAARPAQPAPGFLPFLSCLENKRRSSTTFRHNANRWASFRMIKKLVPASLSNCNRVDPGSEGQAGLDKFRSGESVAAAAAASCR